MSEIYKHIEDMTAAELLAAAESMEARGRDERAGELRAYIAARQKDYEELLARFKARRRSHVDQLVQDDERATAAVLADIQLCIAAIEAVIEEAKAFS